MDGVAIACSGVSWPVLNAAFLSCAVAAPGDLARRIDAARRFYSDRNLGWVFISCDALTDVEPVADDVFTSAGLTRETVLIGMAASSIEPPMRDVPHLEFRRVWDAETQRHIGELNAEAYEIPAGMGREAAANADLWRDNFGYVGYRDGRPVTCALMTPVGNALCASWVATDPAERRRGYAEAALRYALAEAARATGLDRAVLHATPEGYPLYLQLGYHPVASFSVYLAGDITE